MMRKCLVYLALPVCLLAQETKSEVAGDAVVAVINGRSLTADQVRKIAAALPGPVQQALTNDPKQFFKEYAWYEIQQADALKKGLHEQSPWKETLEFQRMLTLVQADWNDAHARILVTPEQQKKYYDENLLKFREVQAKLIYIPFGSSATEDESKGKAEKVVQQAKGGVDFVKLVKEFSQDQSSAAQNGDIGFAIRSSTKQLPEHMKNAVLALKAGQVSDPIRHQNGYYVFRAESAGVLPFEKVKDEIYTTLKDVGFNQWKEDTKAQSSVQFSNEAFFQSLKQQKPQPSPAK